MGKAPLMQPDKNELGDKRLDPKEAVAREREDLLSIIHKRRRIHGQDELENKDRSSGARLHYAELISRLKKLFPRILVKDGTSGNVALYIPKTAEQIARDGYDLLFPQWYNEHRYITGFPKDFIPEWGHIVNDADGIPLREVRGWRSVLIAFFKAGAIGYDEANKEFGDPTLDRRSPLWFEQTAKVRH